MRRRDPVIQCRPRTGAVLALALLSIAASAAATSSGPGEAIFTFDGASSLLGDAEGWCDAQGVLLPSDGAETVLHASAGRLVERTVYLNRTFAAGLRQEEASRLREANASWGPGDVTVSLPPGSLVVAFPDGFPARGVAPLSVHWRGDNVNRSAPLTGDRLPGEGLWVRHGDVLGRQALGFPGSTQRLAVHGPVELSGSFRAYLREAGLRAPFGDAAPRAYEVQDANVSTPWGGRASLRVQDAVLELSDARWSLPEGASLVCQGGRAIVRGEYVVEGASGRLIGAGQPVEFSRRVLSLGGAFDVEERPDAAGMSAHARGDLRAAAFDFGAPIVADSPAAWRVAGALTLAVLLLGVAKFAGSLVGAFYSRFGRDHALDNTNRELVYDAVVANPGLDLAELAGVTSLHRATVTYHVRVLSRVGLVATLRRGKSLRVLERALVNERDLPRVLAQREESLGVVRDLVSQGERPLREVVEALATRFGLTARGAYKIVARAERNGVARRRVIDGEVLIACAAS